VIRRRRAVVDVEAELLHFVRMADLLLADDAQIEVLWSAEGRERWIRKACSSFTSIPLYISLGVILCF